MTSPCVVCGEERILSPLDEIIGVHEAASLWGTTAHYVKKLCYEGKVSAKKIGGSWVIDKNQPNPMKGGSHDGQM